MTEQAALPATAVPIRVQAERTARTIGSLDGPMGLTTFVTTTTDARGERLLMEIQLPRQSRGSRPLHFHPRLSERFEILEGELHVLVGTEHLVLGPGGTAFVPATTNHCFYTGDSPAAFRVELRPAGSFERGARIAAGVGPALVRNPLLMALVIQETEVLFPHLPPVAQRMMIAPLAALAQRFYRRRLAPYEV